MQQLRDSVAVVTGAAGGIGRAIALELARKGMHLTLSDFDLSGLTEVAREVESLGRRAVCVEADVRKLCDVERVLELTLSSYGSCHVAVNNAGVFHGASLLDSPHEQWQRVIDTNLWGVIHGSRVFGAHFVAQKAGHLVNTASAAGLFPVPGMSAYSTTKSAVIALSLQLRWELASEGVGVTVLCPGVVKTGIVHRSGVGLSHLDLEKHLAKAPGAEGLAKKAVRAVTQNRAMVRYGTDAYLFSLLRLLPLWLIDPLGRLIGRKTLRVLRGQDVL